MQQQTQYCFWVLSKIEQFGLAFFHTRIVTQRSLRLAAPVPCSREISNEAKLLKLLLSCWEAVIVPNSSLRQAPLRHGPSGSLRHMQQLVDITLLRWDQVGA